jgi:hypothetical protein
LREFSIYRSSYCPFDWDPRHPYAFNIEEGSIQAIPSQANQVWCKAAVYNKRAGGAA